MERPAAPTGNSPAPKTEGSFLRSVAVVSGGAAGAQALSVVAVPILTRLYAPEAFGVLAVFVSSLSIVLPVASLRYDQAIPVAGSPRYRRALVQLALVIAGLMSIGTAAVAYASYWVFSNPPTLLRELGPYLWVAPLSLAAGGACQALTASSVSDMRFKQVARSRMAQSLGQIAVQAVGGVASVGAGGLVVGDALGRFAACMPLMRVGAELRQGDSRITWQELRSVAFEFRRFPLISSGSALLNGAGLYLPPIVFTALFGAQAGGWLGLSQRVVAIPMGLIGTAVAQVYLGHAATLVWESPRACYELYRQVRRRLLLVGVVAALVLLLGGSRMFAAIFGPQWATAGVYAQVLCPMLLAQFVGSPLSQTLVLLNRLTLQMWLDAVRVSTVVGSLLVAHALGASAGRAIAMMSIATALCYGGLLVLTDKVFKRALERAANAPVCGPTREAVF